MKKNILFSTDNMLGYKENVEKILREKFDVTEYIENYFPLKSERTLYFKLLRETAKKNKLAKKYYQRYIEKYYFNLLDKYQKIKFDYFLVVAGREFSKEFIQELKRRNKGMKCILFVWDRFKYTTLRKSADEFDYIFSFDSRDCEKYGFYFRPSFYLNEIEQNKIEYSKRKYDIYYVGRLRSRERYKMIEEFYNYSQKINLNCYLKLYINKELEKYLPDNYIKDLIIKEMIPYDKNIDIIKNSKCVLDLNVPDQEGLTLRSIEAIGSETKIITTNTLIKEYDFYNDKNIYCIEKIEDISLIPKEFFIEEYKKLPENIKNKYTAKGFIEEIFNVVEKQR